MTPPGFGGSSKSVLMHEGETNGACIMTRALRRQRSQPPQSKALPLLAGFDSINWSSQVRITEALRTQLEDEKSLPRSPRRPVECTALIGSAHASFLAGHEAIALCSRLKTSQSRSLVST